MFTRRCRLLRPQPETERRDHRLFSGNRILARVQWRDEQPPIPPQRPFVPILNYFHQKEDKTHTRPLCGAWNNYWWLISSVDTHVQFTTSPRSAECGTRRTKVWLIRKTFKWRIYCLKTVQNNSNCRATLSILYTVAHLKLCCCCGTPTIKVLNC